MMVARVSTTLAAMFSDGQYISAIPAAGIFAPLIALFWGLFVGVIHFYLGETYTYSLLLMSLMLAISSFGAMLGIWLWVGYCLGDGLLFLLGIGYFSTARNFLDRVGLFYLPSILSYLLLATLLIIIPFASQGLREQSLKFKMPPFLRTILGAIIQLAVVAGLVYVWTQSMPVLIRPIFTWHRNSPSTAAIAPLQRTGWVLSIVAIIFGTARIIAEKIALARPAAKMRARAAQASLRLAAAFKRFRIPGFITVIPKAILFTFLLSGMFEGWLDAILFFIFLVIVLEAREFISNYMLFWMRIVSFVPILIRFIIALAISSVFGYIILNLMWRDARTFLPIIIGTAFSFIVFAILIPGHSARTKSRARRTT